MFDSTPRLAGIVALLAISHSAFAADSWLSTEALRLEATDAQPYDAFGWAIYVDGDTLVVGAHGVSGFSLSGCASFGKKTFHRKATTPSVSANSLSPR